MAGVAREQAEADGGWQEVAVAPAFSFCPEPLLNPPMFSLWLAGGENPGQLTTGGCSLPLPTACHFPMLCRDPFRPDAQERLGKGMPGRTAGVAGRCPTCSPTEKALDASASTPAGESGSTGRAAAEPQPFPFPLFHVLQET